MTAGRLALRVLCALLLAWVASVPRAAADEPRPTGPSSAKECAICHLRWAPTFISGDGGSEFLSRPDADVVQSEKMCFSCHDGSVVDSRIRLLKGARHATGRPPPAGMTIPPELPLDAKGNVTCGTCHSAHGVTREEAAKGDTFFLRVSNKESRMCVMCHGDRAGGPSAGNHPLEPAKEGGTGAVDCKACHDVHGSTEAPMLASTVGDSALCLKCHEDRGNSGLLGLHGGGHPVNVAPLTALPSRALTAAGARMGPRGQVTCLSCHDVHRAPVDDGLLRMDPARSSLCIECHQDRGALVGSSHDLSTSAPTVRNVQDKTATEAGICSPCHVAHGPARRVALSAPRGVTLCRSCHSRDGGASAERMSAGGHPVDVEYEGEPVSCATCHDPHRPTPEGEAVATTRFLRKPAATLCVDCHAEQEAVVGSRHDVTVVAPKSANLDQMPALAGGPCLGCHEMHPGVAQQRFSRLLGPQGIDDVERLCRSCHADGQVAAEAPVKSVSHPLGVSPKHVAKDVDLPLRAIPGRRARDAVVTCSTCHDPHRWRPDGARDAEPFAAGDANTSFLRVANAPDSKLCTSCHAENSTVVRTNHDMSVSAPKLENALGDTVVEAGTCSACHVPHGATSTTALWARTASKQSKMGRVGASCLSCHREGGPAGERQPRVVGHPKVDMVDLSGSGAYPEFPVFNPETGARDRTGQMSCPSCHTAHQWKAGVEGPGDGPAEGDALSSFLRHSSRSLPCRDCHGPEGIYLYQHFHDPDARRRHEELDLEAELKKELEDELNATP